MKKKFLLRINPDLWEEINCWAEEEFRSVNGQMEYLLKQAVYRRKKDQERDQEEPGE